MTADLAPLSGLAPSIAQALAPLLDPMRQRREAYVRLLRSHDWEHEAADGDVYRQGRDSLRLIRELQPMVDPDYEMFNSFAPQRFRDGAWGCLL